MDPSFFTFFCLFLGKKQTNAWQHIFFQVYMNVCVWSQMGCVKSIIYHHLVKPMGIQGVLVSFWNMIVAYQLQRDVLLCYEYSFTTLPPTKRVCSPQFGITWFAKGDRPNIWELSRWFSWVFMSPAHLHQNLGCISHLEEHSSKWDLPTSKEQTTSVCTMLWGTCQSSFIGNIMNHLISNRSFPAVMCFLSQVFGPTPDTGDRMIHQRESFQVLKHWNIKSHPKPSMFVSWFCNTMLQIREWNELGSIISVSVF